MAYNFPVGYQPAQIYYPQQYQPQQQMMSQQSSQAQQQTVSSIIWVQGEAGAKSYLVAPNTTVQLWDSESQVIYLKSADASGMPSMKILDYRIREAAQSQQPQVVASEPMRDYVTRDELTAFETKIQERIESMMRKEGSADE